MKDEINILLEVLEEIKQQNRDIKTTISSLHQQEDNNTGNGDSVSLEDIAKLLLKHLEFNDEFKHELTQVLCKLGQRIQEMKSGITEVRTSQNELFDKLLKGIQSQQTSPSIKVTKYHLFDVKQWVEWVIWGVMITMLSCIVGSAAYLYNANKTMESHALRYRIIRMKQGHNSPIISQLDHLFLSNHAADSINKLRQEVTNYELAVQRQAELLMQQQKLNLEKEKVSKQLKRDR